MYSKSSLLMISVALLTLTACETPHPQAQREHPYDTVIRELQSSDPAVRKAAYIRGLAYTRSPPAYVPSRNSTVYITPLGNGLYQIER